MIGYLSITYFPCTYSHSCVSIVYAILYTRGTERMGVETVYSSEKMQLVITPCKIVTPENFILKLGTYDYVEEVTYYTIFDADRLSGGFSPNR